MVMKVRDIDVTSGTARQRCRAIELSRLRALLSKLVQVGPIRGKGLDPVVIEVSDEDMARLVKGNI